MRVLCVFTNKYPYTTVEPYLESEIQYYGVFDQVFIFSLMVKKSEEKNRRETPNYIKVFPIKISRIKYIVGSMIAIFDHNFFCEVKNLVKEARFSFRRALVLLLFLSRAHVDSKKIYRLLNRGIIDGETVFYTYRFDYQPYMAYLLKKRLKWNNAKIISRAHGYDLFEERSAGQYIPLRSFILEQLSCVYPCSTAGEVYLKSKYPIWENKIKKSYLGTNDYGYKNYNHSEMKNRVFRIVSCSNIVTIKRLDRIIDVLSSLNTNNIEWIHFGSGEEEANIYKLAAEKLKNSINYVFQGRVSNKEILQYYKETNIDLFINLSDGEGLPVSIMEAFSFGIPCVATDVGGTSEIVEQGINGFLVKTIDNTNTIAGIIDQIINMKEEDYLALRLGARKTWEKKFSADKNYRDFVSELMRL